MADFNWHHKKLPVEGGERYGTHWRCEDDEGEYVGEVCPTATKQYVCRTQDDDGGFSIKASFGTVREAKRFIEKTA